MNHFFVLANQDIELREAKAWQKALELKNEKDKEIVLLYVRGNTPPIFTRIIESKKVHSIPVNHNINSNHSHLLSLRSAMEEKIVEMSGNSFSSEILNEIDKYNSIKDSVFISYTQLNKVKDWLDSKDSQEIT